MTFLVENKCVLRKFLISDELVYDIGKYVVIIVIHMNFFEMRSFLVDVDYYFLNLSSFCGVITKLLKSSFLSSRTTLTLS